MLNLHDTVIASLFATLVVPSLALAQTEEKPAIKVIDPDKKIESARAAALDTEHFEIGAHIGLLSVEDINTNASIGLSLRYYFNEKFLLEGSVGSSDTKRTNSEVQGGTESIADRTFTYFGVAGGYQMLKGRSFWGKKRKYNTGLYVLGGVESIDFAEDSDTGFMLGLSYKTLLTDYLTINIDFKNHIFNRSIDTINDDKMTQNPEVIFGINTIF